MLNGSKPVKGLTLMILLLILPLWPSMVQLVPYVTSPSGTADTAGIDSARGVSAWREGEFPTLQRPWSSIHEEKPYRLAPADGVGTFSIIVILVEFTDKSHIFSPSDVASVAIDQLAEYYDEVSFGLTQVTGSTTDWLNLGHDRSYYVQGTSYPSEPRFILVEDAIEAADPYVNFANYDGVVIIHAGQGQEMSGDWKDYWSCEWKNINIPTDDGVSITQAAVSPEQGLSGQLASVGVIAHEFGHDLGLPDLYDTSYNQEFVGHWCLMGKGSWNGPLAMGESPAHPIGWCKIQLGYVDSAHLVEVSTDVTVVVDPLETSTTGVHLVKIPVTSSRYYLIEVRRKIGYDEWLPDEGVLITYVDEGLKSGEGIVKVVDSHPETPTKDDGIFGVGPGEVNTYVNPTHQFSVIVEEEVGQAFKVTVIRAYAAFTNLENGDALLTPDFTFQWTGGAAAGIDHYEFFLDDSLLYTGTGTSYTVTGMDVGLHNATLVLEVAGSGRRLAVQAIFVVDLAPPIIHQVYHNPLAPGFGDAVQVIINVTDDTWIVNASVYYMRGTDPHWYRVNMTKWTDGEWRATLGTFLPGVAVRYYVTVIDAGGRIVTDDNAGSYYSFTVSGVGILILLIIGGFVLLAIVLAACLAIQRRRRRSPEATPHEAAPPPPITPEGLTYPGTPAVYHPSEHSRPPPVGAEPPRYCIHCGSPLPPGSNYCPICGNITPD